MGGLVRWFEQANPLEVTAWATAVLAFVALISIVFNSILAWQARSSTAASREGLKLQGEELEVLKRQVTLQEEQFEAAQEAARPRLRPQIQRVGDLFIEGDVAYVHGSEPAYDIAIWIRGPSRPGASWGLYWSSIGFMTAADHQLRFMAGPAEANEQADCPFPEFLEQLELQARDYFVGVTWRRLDDVVEKQSFMQTLSLKEPPGVSG
jgi:hypothetical protein